LIFILDGRSSIRDDETQLTDDEDNNNRGVPSNEQDLTEIEQQKKRRRTANYQNILPTKTTNGHHDQDDRIFSPLSMNLILLSIAFIILFFLLTASTDSIRSLSNLRLDHTSNTTPVLLQTSIEQNPNERINRLTSSKQRFNLLPTYRGSTSNYDPSKSPLFSTGNRVSKILLLDKKKTLFYRKKPKQEQILSQMNFQLIIY
jgi:hypothetical protein